MQNRYFTQNTFNFLSQLASNNHRDWFLENKHLYEETVRTPALNFITDFSDELIKISPHFTALPKKVGGSLMRVNRDVRFGKDKRPYKTNIGIQFRHEVGKDIHAPGFYLHIENDACFIGVGLWKPDSKALGHIRDAIVEKSDHWLTQTGGVFFNQHFKLEGRALKIAPRGYAKDHPLIKDLRRQDFIAIASVPNKFMLSKDLIPQISTYFSEASDFMQFLCQALGVRF